MPLTWTEAYKAASNLSNQRVAQLMRCAWKAIEVTNSPELMEATVKDSHCPLSICMALDRLEISVGTGMEPKEQVLFVLLR